jgi:uncharacterized membrane protein
MKPDRTPMTVLLLLAVVAAVQVAHYYPRLPESIAVHFGPRLEADGWQGRQGFAITYACVEAAVVVMTLGMRLLIGRVPVGMVNIPHRDYWLAPERRKETLRCVMAQVDWIMVAMLAYLIAIAQVIFDANVHAAGRPPALPGDFWVVVVAFLAAIAWFIVGIYRRFGKPPRHPDTGTAR